jgi:hypothetical protein
MSFFSFSRAISRSLCSFFTALGIEPKDDLERDDRVAEVVLDSCVESVLFDDDVALVCLEFDELDDNGEAITLRPRVLRIGASVFFRMQRPVAGFLFRCGLHVVIHFLVLSLISFPSGQITILYIQIYFFNALDNYY